MGMFMASSLHSLKEIFLGSEKPLRDRGGGEMTVKRGEWKKLVGKKKIF